MVGPKFKPGDAIFCRSRRNSAVLNTTIKQVDIEWTEDRMSVDYTIYDGQSCMWYGDDELFRTAAELLESEKK